MRKRILPLLLVMAAALSITLTAVQAEDIIGPFFFMKVVSNAEGDVREGQQFTADIYGGAIEDETNTMISFQFRLDYPKDRIKLVKLEPMGSIKTVGICRVNTETDKMAYNTGTAEGLKLGIMPGTLLARATFEVLPDAQTGTVKIGLKEAEISRIKDEKSTLGFIGASDPVSIYRQPMLMMPEEGNAADNFVEPELYKNPAGKLIIAVYNNEQQMLRCLAADAPENAGKQKISADLSGGTLVKVFLVDEKGYNGLCPAAEMKLK